MEEVTDRELDVGPKRDKENAKENKESEAFDATIREFQFGDLENAKQQKEEDKEE